MTDRSPGLEHVRTVHKTCQLLDATATELKQIAKTLAYVHGHTGVVGDLLDLAQPLRLAAKELRDSHGAALSADLRTAEEHSGNMLRAVLAGVFTGSDNPETKKSAADLLKATEPRE